MLVRKWSFHSTRKLMIVNLVHIDLKSKRKIVKLKLFDFNSNSAIINLKSAQIFHIPVHIDIFSIFRFFLIFKLSSRAFCSFHVIFICYLKFSSWDILNIKVLLKGEFHNVSCADLSDTKFTSSDYFLSVWLFNIKSNWINFLIES
jgi:hypothetical protein